MVTRTWLLQSVQLNFYLLSFTVVQSMTCRSEPNVSVNTAKIILMWKWHNEKQYRPDLLPLCSYWVYSVDGKWVNVSHLGNVIMRRVCWRLLFYESFKISQYVTCSIVITFSICAVLQNEELNMQKQGSWSTCSLTVRQIAGNNE